MKHYLESMTAAQRAATLHKDGPALVLASPGAGKTRCITYRLVELVDSGVNPGSIVAITFTNKAADEMRKRIKSIMPASQADRINISTFHSFCAKLLRYENVAAGLPKNYTIADGDDSLAYVAHAICVLTNAKSPKDVKNDRTAKGAEYQAKAIARIKMQLLTPDDLLDLASASGEESDLDKYTRQVYERYQAVLNKSNCLDFSDLLMRAVMLLRDHQEVREKYASRIKYLLIDEYQDTNLAQYMLAKALSSISRNIFVVGDSDQSIYRFQGAEPENIFRFERDFQPDVKIYFLEENFRSTPQIADAANSLIVNNTKRKDKLVKATKSSGEPVRCIETRDNRQEAGTVVDEIIHKVKTGNAKWGDFAILYRTHSKSRMFEELLVKHNVPHVVVGGVGFYGRKVVKDILAYVKLRLNKNDDASFERIYDVPPRRFGDLSYAAMYQCKEDKKCTFTDLFTTGEYETLLKATKTTSGGKKLKSTLDKIYDTPTNSVEKLITNIIDASGIRTYFEVDNKVSNVDALDSLDELIDAARTFDQERGGGAEQFIEWTTLMQSGNENKNDPNKVTLMTCHAAKGLEFSNVYVVSAVDGYMPFIRDVGDDGEPKDEVELKEDEEEERRVFFVAVTRAEKRLVILHNQVQVFGPRVVQCTPSRFLDELGEGVERTSIADTGAGLFLYGGASPQRMPRPRRRFTY